MIFGETVTISVEQYVGNALVGKETVTNIPFMLEMMMKDLIVQTAQSNQPRKVKFIRIVPIYDKELNTTKYIECYIEFQNWRD